MSEKIESKQIILIADDSEMNRSILTDMLEEEYGILEAADGSEAIAMIKQHEDDIDLLLLDINMPKMNGFEVLEAMQKYRWIETIPVIMISASNSAADIEKAYELGATDYINRPFDEAVVHRRVNNTIMLYTKQKRLMTLVEEQVYERQLNNSMMINILSHIVEFRNGESGLHVLHVSTITELLLKHLLQKTDAYNVSKADIAMIGMASALHDIGKIAIPDEILNKPGRLTPEEFAVMKTHSMIGYKMLTEFPGHEEEPLIRYACEITRWHHERYDGKGYPDGLVGDGIPISAQLVSLADVYDALTSERVYKKAIPHEKAIEMILNGECGCFNPLLLECLTDIADTLQEELLSQNSLKSTKREVENVAEEMLLHNEEASASERTLRLLEAERERNRTLELISNEIPFDYTVNPKILSFSEWGAERLGTSPVILEPRSNEKLLAFIHMEDYDRWSEHLRATTAEEPVTRFSCQIRVDGEWRECRFIMKASWVGEDKKEFAGAVGKMMVVE